MWFQNARTVEGRHVVPERKDRGGGAPCGSRTQGPWRGAMWFQNASTLEGGPCGSRTQGPWRGPHMVPEGKDPWMGRNVVPEGKDRGGAPCGSKMFSANKQNYLAHHM